MRKKAVILVSVYVVMLIIGVMAHVQKGMYIFSDFWTLQKDGSYEYYGDRISRRASSDGQATYDLLLNGNELTAEVSNQDEEWTVSFSDGSDAIVTGSMWSGFAVDGVFWSGDFELVLNDMEAMGLVFGRAAGEERHAFYDEQGNEVGESIHLMSESGQTISYREVFYDHPELNQEAPEIVELKEGMRISSEGHNRKLYVNEAGEYLLNPDRMFFFNFGSGSMSRSSLARVLIGILDGKPESRGEWPIIFLYTIFYALGAAVFLWPEQLAFFGHRWRFQTEPELSDMGIMMEMIGGVLVMGVSVFLLFYPLFVR